MPDKKAMALAAGSYLANHPEEILRALKNAFGLRVGLPLDALRFLAGEIKGKKAPKDLRLVAVPPGIRASAVVNLAGTEVRAGATVFVEDVRLDASEVLFELRLADVEMKLIDDASDSPVATLLKSGALDLSKPGNLAAFMPKRPAMLVDAKDDRIVIDLRKHPKLAGNAKADRMLSIVTAFLTLRAIQTDTDHLDLVLKLLPHGVDGAMESVRGVL
ncbi:MAG TPA: hypothetical protein PKA88_25590 [Polyangiaceae bacterium]|nr:hypothetical protein [Polyangiaceae bacterium]